MLYFTALETHGLRTGAASEFPFTIGRSSTAHFRLESPGVWDQHATISIRDGRFLIAPEGQALLLRNGEPFQGGPLRLGDEFSLGGARLTASLAPATQFNLATPEVMIAALIAATAFAQTLLILAIG